MFPKLISHCCRLLQVITQISLFLLLFGTLCGDFALLHDAALRAVNKLWLGAPPGVCHTHVQQSYMHVHDGDDDAWHAQLYHGGLSEGSPSADWLLAADGRLILAAVAVALVFPLCCLRRMRSVNSNTDNLDLHPIHATARCELFLKTEC